MDMSEHYQARFNFIELLSREFVARTGCGIYVYLSPIDIDQLFCSFQDQGQSLKVFVRHTLKSVLG